MPESNGMSRWNLIHGSRPGPLLASLLVAILATACTTISVKTDGGSVEVTRRAGFAYIELPPGADTVADIRVLGFAKSSLGGGFGFIRQRVAALDGDCRLVIWVESSGQMEAALAIAAEHPEICVITKEDQQ